jgi:hypothetical protein
MFARSINNNVVKNKHVHDRNTIEGSLEVKLPTYGQMKKQQRWDESEKKKEKE